jgi:hypothetical protein
MDWPQILGFLFLPSWQIWICSNPLSTRLRRCPNSNIQRHELIDSNRFTFHKKSFPGYVGFADISSMARTKRILVSHLREVIGHRPGIFSQNLLNPWVYRRSEGWYPFGSKSRIVDLFFVTNFHWEYLMTRCRHPTWQFVKRPRKRPGLE